MSLHKPGKEHTINFIYCWAALHPDPSHRSDPYSQRLGPGPWKTRQASGKSIPGLGREPQEWGGPFRPFVSPGGPTEPDPRISPRRPRTSR